MKNQEVILAIGILAICICSPFFTFSSALNSNSYLSALSGQAAIITLSPTSSFYVLPQERQSITANINNNAIHVVANITLGKSRGPVYELFDPANKEIYVADYDTGTVSVIDSQSNKLIKTIATGSYPATPLYDPENQYVYVCNAISGTVSIINGTSNKVIQTIVTGYGTSGVAYDSTNKDVYVLGYPLRIC